MNGYHFAGHLVLDAAYGAHATDPAHFSGLEGVGVSCSWTRTGPDVPTAHSLFGAPPDPAEIAGYAPLKSGTIGGRTGGLPRLSSDDANETHVVCGVRDDQGAQGLELVIHFVGDSSGRPTATAVTAGPWQHP